MEAKAVRGKGNGQDKGDCYLQVRRLVVVVVVNSAEAVIEEALGLNPVKIM